MGWLDALLGRIRSAGADIALGKGLNFLAPLSAELNSSTDYIDVSVDLPDALAGSTSIVVASDIQRAALTGAVEAAQNVNATTFGTNAAGDSMARQTSNQALGYVGAAAATTPAAPSGAMGVIDIGSLPCGGTLSLTGDIADFSIAGFTAKTDGYWFQIVAGFSLSNTGTLLNNSGNTTTSLRLPLGRNIRFRGGEAGVAYYYNQRWRVTWGRRPEDLDVLTQTSAQTVTNNTTNLTPGSLSIPADVAVAGSEWQFEAMLHTSRGATATAANVIVELLVGGSVIRTLTIATTTTSGHLGYAVVRGRFSVRTAGAGGTAMVTLGATESITQGSATPDTVSPRFIQQPQPAAAAVAATSFDTTAASSLELRARFSAAVANLAMHMYDCTIQRVK